MVFALSLMAQEKDNFSVQVDGLGCPFCAYGLEKTFDEFKGIDDVKIDMETGIMTFTLPSDQSVDLEAVSDKVVKAGYTAVESTLQKSSGEELAWSNAEPKNIKTKQESNSLTSSTLLVKGSCDMCKSRIEKAVLGMDGVNEASWEKESQTLSLTYDITTQSLDSISETLAKLGHDTALHQADNEAYDKLHTCCKYKR